LGVPGSSHRKISADSGIRIFNIANVFKIFIKGTFEMYQDHDAK